MAKTLLFRRLSVVVLMFLATATRLTAEDATNSVPPAATNATPAAPAAAPARAKSGVDFSAFQLITQRNIFNANRHARRPGGPGDTVRPPRIDWFALRGVMSYEDQSFAFFDGTTGEFRTTLKPADTIAGYKIAAITTEGVTLTVEGGKPVELRINSQMKRTEGGPWSLVADPDMALSGPESGGAEPGAAIMSGAIGAQVDVIKRMMERRAAENK